MAGAARSCGAGQEDLGCRALLHWLKRASYDSAIRISRGEKMSAENIAYE